MHPFRFGIVAAQATSGGAWKDPVLVAREAATPHLVSARRGDNDYSARAMIASKAPTVLTGTHETMIEQLQAARESMGLSYLIVNGTLAQWFAPVVERLSGS